MSLAVADVKSGGYQESRKGSGNDFDRSDPAGAKPAFRVHHAWATLALAVAAVLALGFPVLAAQLIYDRSLLQQGQCWRGWTGHIVHFGPNHLFWDLAVLLPAGCWLEYLWPRLARWFYVGCPLAISAVLFVFEPTLLRYAGLSGLATGVLVLLAGMQLGFANDGRAWLWWSVLALVGAKIGHELIAGAPLVVTDIGGNIRSVPLAHVGGGVCGVVVVVLTRLANRLAGKGGNSPA